MIHYFNPGNETAILNASKYYHPPVNQIKMQKELAFLPAWYAQPNDFVLINQKLPSEFIRKTEDLNMVDRSITVSDFIDRKETLNREKICLWGPAPNSIHLFEKIKSEYNLDIDIPKWKTEYALLSSRHTAFSVLKKLMSRISSVEKDILPSFFSEVTDIEQYVSDKNTKLVLKSPYSSSGRGIVWLPPGQLNRSERQIIGGMLKKQRSASVEKKLDKLLDFSAHFEITPDKAIRFAGYSLFETGTKGNYEKSILLPQNEIEKTLFQYIGKGLLSEVTEQLKINLSEEYAPYYEGNLGVDMMIYLSGNRFHLHPCVEINMRKSMGYLSLQLQKNYLHPDSKGFFAIEYNNQPGQTIENHREKTKHYPFHIKEHKIVSGYSELCPVNENTNYHAYVLIHGR